LPLQEHPYIDYITRIDKQLKIRRFTIQLSQIQKPLQPIPHINKPLLILPHQHQHKQILPYYQPSQLKSTRQLKHILTQT
ncbi:hypothetical protein, partial [Staphylococcus epidermidis]|uniref:hypothetical protein n=1 Tax=Staphylococcus epidermidis TaxID=1282 RepID=UPI001C930B23